MQFFETPIMDRELREEQKDELDLDAKNVLEELKKMYEEDISAGDMEVILVDYLKDKGYTVLYPKPDWSK